VHAGLVSVGDFVMFDDDAMLRYRYTPEGRLLGYDFTEEAAEVLRGISMRNRLLAAAVPLADLGG